MLKIKLAESHPFTPQKPGDYIICCGVFVSATFLIAGIGMWGVRVLTEISNWPTHITIYGISTGLGVTFCSGAAIYCINQARIMVDDTAADFRSPLKRTLRKVFIELLGLTLAMVQLVATTVVVLIIGTHIFGYPVPSFHALASDLKHWL